MNKITSTPRWRRLLLAALLAGCGQAASLQALEPAADSACALDGMVLRDYPGAKAQIRYGDGKTDYFCDVVELLRTLLAPEQARGAAVPFVQDMGKADWRRPQGHWIAARAAVYVVGSRAVGSMGPTVVPFAQRADAEAFAGREGGRVLAFADLSPATLGGPAHGH
ncbi:nitrous oxide reductase accessory protein NosL [Massilia sp. YMA4]|uniref:nitrous oxide reductase accessory protein NosL n=1 Tax=Massilia sp. YMA4 TaxID=1593482 RepID=UPI000DD17E26|nr:nitrous oxide reductase accessory protein NosL [Massilia sp. YMA4]AXA92200.1 nitrous oxide reductase accessory protein NosL [Massilia sp. YMA4]